MRFARDVHVSFLINLSFVFSEISPNIDISKITNECVVILLVFYIYIF